MTKNLCTTLQQRLCDRIVPRALPMLEPVDYKYKINESVRHSFLKHNYIKNIETIPADTIISSANLMTETLRTYTPIKMCKEDLEALQRLETIFSRAAQTNSDV